MPGIRIFNLHNAIFLRELFSDCFSYRGRRTSRHVRLHTGRRINFAWINLPVCSFFIALTYFSRRSITLILFLQFSGWGSLVSTVDIRSMTRLQREVWYFVFRRNAVEDTTIRRVKRDAEPEVYVNVEDTEAERDWKRVSKNQLKRFQAGEIWNQRSIYVRRHVFNEKFDILFCMFLSQWRREYNDSSSQTWRKAGSM